MMEPLTEDLQEIKLGDSSEAAKSGRRSSIACMSCRKAKLRCDWSQRAKVAETNSAAIVVCSRCERLGKEGCHTVKGKKGGKTPGRGRPKADIEEEVDDKPATDVKKKEKPRLSPINVAAAQGPLPSPALGTSSSGLTMPRVAQYSPSALLSPTLIPQQYSDSRSPGISSDGSSPPSRVFAGTPFAENTSQSSTHSVLVGAPEPAASLCYPYHSTSVQSGAFQLPAGSCTLARLNFRVPQAQLQEGLDMILEQPLSPGHEIWQEAALPMPVRAKPDVNHGLDPVDAGIVSEDQLSDFFGHFFSTSGAHESAPTLDPDLHVISYVRMRSALLTTTIALLAAQSIGGQAHIAHQLSAHIRYLRRQVLEQKYKSLEICQALQMLSIWPRCDIHETDDQTVTLAQALAIALDLGIDRDGPESSSLSFSGSMLEAREIRNRQRMLITFYVWDRAASIADNRRVLLGLPDDYILPWLDAWATHPVAAACDPMLIQHAALRYEATLIRKSINRELAMSSATLPKLLTALVREKLGRWLQHFQTTLRAGSMPQRHMAHLLIIYHTMRAHLLAMGLPQTQYPQHCGNAAGDELIAETRLACLDACETVVLQCGALLQLPSNVSVAVVQCALQALRLHRSNASSTAELAPLVGLLAQVASFLEISGTWPMHRAGPNAKYGQYLFAVLRTAAEPLIEGQQPPLPLHSPLPPQTPVQAWHRAMPPPDMSLSQYTPMQYQPAPQQLLETPIWRGDLFRH